ncbi:hypothetical protein AXF42_Ash011444 [Apostasia shenzhenica]|uniref:Uncharacterized protein n=1 Tax=Apostasia shenzhenica TaxID=1088818 RepID=A0A2I0BAL0_9ASPA|nr:hypothetical protein AXF42_Ash011444 [Apostasia shenzhenica]
MASRSRVESIVSMFVSVHSHEIPALIHSSSCFFFVICPSHILFCLHACSSEFPANDMFVFLDGLMKSTSQFSISHLTSSKEKGTSGTENDHALHDGWGNHDWFYISVRIGLFLWVALLNLITISSTWARVIDIMGSPRLFGFVGAGATLGQLFGSLFAASMAWLGPLLLLFSAILMELAAQSSKGIVVARNHGSAELSCLREDENFEDIEEASSLIQSSPQSPTFTAKSQLAVMLEGLWLIVLRD